MRVNQILGESDHILRLKVVLHTRLAFPLLLAREVFRAVGGQVSIIPATEQFKRADSTHVPSMMDSILNPSLHFKQ